MRVLSFVWKNSICLTLLYILLKKFRHFTLCIHICMKHSFDYDIEDDDVSPGLNVRSCISVRGCI